VIELLRLSHKILLYLELLVGNPIIFDRVSKIYHNRQVALSDMSFRIPEGSTVGLLGANGSGKSTAIRMMLGLIRPSAGAIEVLGKPMHPAAKDSRQRIGYLSDNPVFPKDLTAIAYLSFVGRCFGLGRRDLNGRIGNLLRAVGLKDEAGRKTSQYSTGMKTRLGIAASLMNDPELLVWDEPTAGLDPISRKQTLDLLEKIGGQKTIILSSHILGDIDRVCDRLLVFNQGQLLFDGHRTELENLLPETLLEIHVSGDLESFRSRLNDQFKVRELQTRKERGRFLLEFHREKNIGVVIDQLVKLTKECDVDIQSINSTGRRLEDSYLKLISEDEFRGFVRYSKA